MSSRASLAKHTRCAEVAGQIVAQLGEGAPEGDKEYYRQRYLDLYTRRCTQDHWSDDAQRCFIAPRREHEACNHLLMVRQLNMIECVDDAAVTTGRPPSTPEEVARIAQACENEQP